MMHGGLGPLAPAALRRSINYFEQIVLTFLFA
jgi:hypothetical protein